MDQIVTVRAADILRAASEIAYSDPANYFDEKGNLLGIPDGVCCPPAPLIRERAGWRPASARQPDRTVRQPSLDLASFTIATSAVRTSSDVLTGLANATRTGRGPSGVLADISKPYRSTPAILAEVISVDFEKALQ